MCIISDMNPYHCFYVYIIQAIKPSRHSARILDICVYGMLEQNKSHFNNIIGIKLACLLHILLNHRAFTI